MRLRNRTNLTAAALALTTAGPIAAAAPAVITQPDWVRKPDAEALSQHYPDIATEFGLDGYAVISCTVTAQGGLAGCHADIDRPAGIGFGRAAVEMSSLFEMKPQTLNGQPVDGGKINIPIRFQAPQLDPETEPPAPVSEDAARQALRLTDAVKAADAELAGYETLAGRLSTDERASPAAGQAASAALRKASVAHREEMRMALSRAFASVFSEAELAGLADHGDLIGPHKGPDSQFAEVDGQLKNNYWRDLSIAAHQAFCAKQACSAPAGDVQRVWRAADGRDASRLDNPQWAFQPSDSDVTSVRPKLPLLLGLTGVVRMTCKLVAEGLITDCGVDEEAPAGLGYGAAAISLAPAYRLSPLQQLTTPVGHRVTVRVGFPALETPKPFQSPTASAHAIALARQLADPEEIRRQARLQTELQLTDFSTNPPQGSDPKLQAAAIDAYRAGSEKALTNYVELAIQNAASAYPEPLLEAQAAFRATPAGKAQKERAKELAIAIGKAQSWVALKVRADAKREFCAASDCATGAPPAPQPKAASAAPSTRTP